MQNTELTIAEFAPGDEADFRTLNEAWIVRYFDLEAKDIEALSDPRKNILDGGGRIFMARVGGTAVGCGALIARGSGEFEVAKMAVAESAQRGGIGRRLLTHIIEACRSAGVNRLYLETNSVLKPAIHLYESLGFCHVPPERIVPSPYRRSNVVMELVLTRADFASI